MFRNSQGYSLDNETSKIDVAKQIKELLGGDVFIETTGAKHFGGDDCSLNFKLPNQVANFGINLVIITQEALGNYRMVFYKKTLSSKPGVVILTYEDVDGLDLQYRFQKATGLRCK